MTVGHAQFLRSGKPDEGVAVSSDIANGNGEIDLLLNGPLQKVPLPEGMADHIPAPKATEKAVSSFFLDYAPLVDALSATGTDSTIVRVGQNGANTLSVASSFRFLIENTPNGLVQHSYGRHELVVDSIRIALLHRNNSGLANTITIRLHTIDTASAFYSETPVWSEDYIATSSLAVNGGLIDFPVNYALCSDSAFAVSVTFDGAAADSFYVFTSYTVGCNDTCGAAEQNPVYWPQSFRSLIRNGNLETYPQPSATMPGFITFLFSDCNGNMTEDTCEYSRLQNWLISPFVSITDQGLPPLTATTGSTPDNGTSNGTAWITPSGGVGEYEILWGTSPFQMGDTARNVPAGEYPVVVTYGHECEEYVERVTVDSNVGIEDLSKAGISSMEAYPNPTSGLLTLDMELDRREDVRVQVMTVTGKVLFETAINQVERLRQPIDLGDVAPGVYMLNVTTSRGSAAQRILVN
jgi:hypothetical protein